MDARRMPARVRRISDIDISRDVRVRIFGRVIERGADYFIMDDEASKIKVSCTPDIASRLFDGQYLRLYAQVLPADEGISLRAEIVQDATGTDVKLYKTAEKMWIEAGNGL